MGLVLHPSPHLDHWRFLSVRVRCAVDADEPRSIEHYLAQGRYLARFTATPSTLIAETTFHLLLDTARDTALPWHWRCLCLDQAWRPLRDLHALAQTPARHERYLVCVHELAACVLQPSITPNEFIAAGL